MDAIASQITSLTIVYSTVYSDADQSKHQSSASLAFVRGIHRGPVNSPHKWPVTRKMFPFDDVIMYWHSFTYARSTDQSSRFPCLQAKLFMVPVRGGYVCLICIVTGFLTFFVYQLQDISVALYALRGKHVSRRWGHYNDVIMSEMASQITSLTIVYSTIYSRCRSIIKHQNSASLTFVRGIHRGPVNSPHEGPVTRKMFPFDDVIMFLTKTYCGWSLFFANIN